MSANSTALEPLGARHRKSAEPLGAEILQISGTLSTARHALEIGKYWQHPDRQSFVTRALIFETKTSREKIVTIETTKHPGTPLQQERFPRSCEIETLGRLDAPKECAAPWDAPLCAPHLRSRYLQFALRAV